MSTIFSPSACSWKPSNPRGKCFSHSKGKSAREKDEHQAGTAVKGAALALLNESFWWRASICSRLHFSKRCHAFCYFEISVPFSRGAPPSSAPADWFAWPPSQWNGGFPPARFSSEKFDHSAGIWLGEIHPICAHNETAWQGTQWQLLCKVYSATA